MPSGWSPTSWPDSSRAVVGRGILLLALLAVASSAAAQVPPTAHQVMVDGHALTVWSRSASAPVAAVLLVHGRTWSARPDFDLQIPGMERSVMQSLARRGFAVYAVDLRGYGRTPRDSSGFLTPTRAAADIVGVLRWMAARHPSLPRPALLGWSLGGAVAHLAAQTRGVPLSALVLFGFIKDPDLDYARLNDPQTPARSRTTRADAIADFITPAVTPRAVIEAFAAQALAADPVRMDWIREHEFNAIAPGRISVPTLVLHGDRDPGIPADAVARYFSRLTVPHRQWTVLAGGDHAAQLEDSHDAFIDAVAGFLLRPTVRPPGGRTP